MLGVILTDFAWDRLSIDFEYIIVKILSILGLNFSIIYQRKCVVQVDSLVASPFSLSYQAQVNATVTAINMLGDSVVSSPGNGAVIPTLLGAPKDLV